MTAKERADMPTPSTCCTPRRLRAGAGQTHSSISQRRRLRLREVSQSSWEQRQVLGPSSPTQVPRMPG